MQNQMRLIEDSTISDFVSRQIHVMRNLTDHLKKPGGKADKAVFDFEVSIIWTRVMTLRNIDALYDEEFERLERAHERFKEAMKGV